MRKLATFVLPFLFLIILALIWYLISSTIAALFQMPLWWGFCVGLSLCAIITVIALERLEKGD